MTSGADQNLSSQPSNLRLGLCSRGGSDSREFTPGGGVVEGVTTHKEDLCELFVVVSHHGRLGSLLGHGQEVVDVPDGTKSLLPQSELG